MSFKWFQRHSGLIGKCTGFVIKRLWVLVHSSFLCTCACCQNSIIWYQWLDTYTVPWQNGFNKLDSLIDTYQLMLVHIYECVKQVCVYVSYIHSLTYAGISFGGRYVCIKPLNIAQMNLSMLYYITWYIHAYHHKLGSMWPVLRRCTGPTSKTLEVVHCWLRG